MARAGELELNSMTAMESATHVQNTILEYQTGSLSLAEVISKLQLIPLEEAEEKAKVIEKELRTKKEWEMKQQGNESNKRQ